MTSPGSLYTADLTGARGREQHGVRPVLVISDENFTAPGLLFVVPLTTTDRHLPHHVPVPADQVTRLHHPSFAMTEQTRALSINRLLAPRPIGQVAPQTLTEVRSWLARQAGL